uniref:Uncharacterized protein n=1 Tax=Magallana gigas TaxID=29159 RepID=A0A8W8MLR8_MAGGI
MNSLTYVSDPRIWEAFYKNMAEKKFNPYKYKPKQIGRGTKRHRSYVIPLRPHSQLESTVNTAHVTPVAAVEERAKAEHANDIKEGLKMAFLSGDNKDIAQPMELSLFSSPTNQVAVEKVYFTEARPISSIGVSDTPIEIVVSGSGAEYIDLKRSKLYVKARILKTDGTALADTEKTGIVNLPLQSMFSQMDVYLNNKLVSFNTNNYPWKAYLKTILFCGKTNWILKSNQNCSIKTKER